MRRFLICLLKAPVRFYRAAVSPLTGAKCRFYPACSAYALEALDKHGPARGLYLTARRLLRCHPFCKGGIDPVPPSIEKTRKKP